MDKIDEYIIGNSYYFKITNFGVFINKNDEQRNTIEVEDSKGNKLSVLGFPWHDKNIWNFDSLICEVESIRADGIPNIKSKDFRHPIYEVGKCYQFKIIGTNKRVRSDNYKEQITFSLKGEDNCIHEVNALPGQLMLNPPLEIIECEILSIKYNLRLKQDNVKDPFFITAENLISDPRLVKKYFSPSIKGEKATKNDKLIEQYSSSSAFWVLTFCNKILPRIFKENISRYNYKDAFEVNQLIIDIEKWILNKGIITSFADDNLKQITIRMAEAELSRASTIKNVLSRILQLNFPSYVDILPIEEVYYLLLFTEFSNNDYKNYIQSLIYHLNTKSTLSTAILNMLQGILKIIARKKKQYIIKGDEDYFSLTGNINNQFLNDDFKDKYLGWTYCQYCIYLKLENVIQSKLLLSQLLRHYFYIVDSLQIKKTLLHNAYHVLNNKYTDDIPFSFNGTLNLNFSILKENPNLNENISTALDKQINTIKINQILEVDITTRYSSGYEVVYGGMIGFLPNHLISDIQLRKTTLDQVDFTISVRCILVSKEFNFFVVKQLLPNEEGFISNNNLMRQLTAGLVITGVVKNVEDYGIFVDTIFITGLLHKKNISDDQAISEKLIGHLKKGDKITVVTLNDDDEKLDLGVKQLENTEYHDIYVNLIESLTTQHEEVATLDFITEEEVIQNQVDLILMEKAYCFEQYALIINNIDDKIQNFQLAMELFTTLSDSRYYLINIFTDYFKILQLVRLAINEYSEENITKIKEEVSKIKEKISEKTIKRFPDSEKLIYFIDIISMFNDKTETNIDKLYKYVSEYKGSKTKENLRTIAKITLSNNLMLSETESDSHFSRRNLQLLNSYIQSGVLSLKQTEADKAEIELEANIKYWRSKIADDENQKIEFKSTMRTPILDQKRIKDLAILKAQNLTDNIKIKIDEIEGELAKKRIMHSALKTLCAFANTSGGILMLGVNNEKQITGLEIDYTKLTPKNRDGFGLMFDAAIKTYFEESFSALLIKEFIKFPEGDVLLVHVKPSLEEVFILKNELGQNQEELYIRNTTSTEILKGSQLAKFIKLRQIDKFKNWSIPEDIKELN